MTKRFFSRVLLYFILLVETFFSLGGQEDTLSFHNSFSKRLQMPFSSLFPCSEALASVEHFVHIGDSHLQSGYLAERIRTSFASSYHLLGYGLITPYQIAGSNAPMSYQYRSPQKWHTCTISYTKQCSPQPPCGILLAHRGGATKGFSFFIASPSYPFDCIVYYRGVSSPPLRPIGGNYRIVAGKAVSAGMVADTIYLGRVCREVSLAFSQTQEREVYYGGMLLLRLGEKARHLMPSILYSPIGHNGAMYATYTKEIFIDALSSLKPSYLLISLGTNESLAPRFRKDQFKAEVVSLLEALSHSMPDVKIILSTPPPNFKRGVFNRNSLYARDAILEVGDAMQLAVVDLYALLGGEKGALQWRKEGGYYAKDGIHFSVRGYEHQGNLLAEALKELLKQAKSK